MDFKYKKNTSISLKAVFSFLFVFILLSSHTKNTYEKNIKEQEYKPEKESFLFYQKKDLEKFAEENLGINVKLKDSVQIVDSFVGYEEITPIEYNTTLWTKFYEDVLSKDENPETIDFITKKMNRLSYSYYDWKEVKYEDVYLKKGKFLLNLAYNADSGSYALKSFFMPNIDPIPNSISKQDIYGISNEYISKFDYLSYKTLKDGVKTNLFYRSNQLKESNAIDSDIESSISEYKYMSFINLLLSLSLMLFIFGFSSYKRKVIRKHSNLRITKMRFFNFKQRRENNNLLKEKVEESKIIRQKKKRSIEEAQREEIKITIDND